MTRYWALALLGASIAVVYFVRRLLARKRPAPVDIPFDDLWPSRPEVMRLPTEDDTAPAVLSAPEWKPPKKRA
jgi:hypothetical protein